MALGCCQASGSGLTSALAGQVCSFRIAAHDANGNPIMTGGAEFTVKVTCEGDTWLTLLLPVDMLSVGFNQYLYFI